jgi:serralysin
MSIVETNFSPVGNDGILNGIPGPDYAAYFETTDALGSTATGYTIAAGDTFNGSVGSSGDTDWVRISLVAGQSYTFTLDGYGGGALSDPYLELRNSAGVIIAENDDASYPLNINSLLSFTAVTSGTYYLTARGYDGTVTGDYQLTTAVAPPLPVYTMTEIAQQLSHGYWQSDLRDWRHFNVAQGDTLNVDISGLNAAGKLLAAHALAAWTTMTGINFNTAPGAGATIHITMDDNDLGSAYSDSTLNGHTIVNSTVNIGSDWGTGNGSQINNYWLQTYIHELGHALGLGHAGNYNGDATYGVDNHYLNDSWQATIMSYFDQDDNTYVNATHAYVVTPMLADILAMQTLYGVPTGIRAGFTIYGENSNAGGIYADISALLALGTPNPNIAFTILDQGGIDVLDLRSDTAAQIIRLAQGAASNIYGEVGNMIIATGTVIERVLAGQGNDLVIGNSAGNDLSGNVGNDTLRGMGGHDVLRGGAGADTLLGGTGNDTLHGAGGTNFLSGEGGNDRLFGGINNDRLFGGTGSDVLNAGGGADTLVGNAGNDTLWGGAGNDALAGSAGRDRLNGGAGADRFIFLSVSDSTNAAYDTITDFVSGTDRINLAAIDANTGVAGDQAFSFIGHAVFSTAAQLRYYAANGGVMVTADINGDHVADLRIFLDGVATLTATDFLL